MMKDRFRELTDLNRKIQRFTKVLEPVGFSQVMVIDDFPVVIKLL